MFLNTLNDSVERLYRALVLLDWTRGCKVSSFLDRHRPAVLKVVNLKQLTKEFDSKTVVYYMSSAEAAALDVVLVISSIYNGSTDIYLNVSHWNLVVRLESHYDQCHMNTL